MSVTSMVSRRGDKEGEEEAKAFSDYVEWCDEAAANLRNEIKTGDGKPCIFLYPAGYKGLGE